MIQSDQATLQRPKIPQLEKSETTFSGIIIAFSIILLWASNLIFLLNLDLSNIPIVVSVAALILQTFLYTGLFITAHDAIHGVVFPQNLKINHLIGSVAVFLYALFPYEKLFKKHWLHHQHPATELDPDFHDLKHKNFFAWYFHFMNQHWTWMQMLGMMAIFNTIKYTFHIPENNLILFWALPSILSAVQLFYFGTFLPHQEPEGGYTNRHRAQTISRATFLSFITCYHFGYHEEHHEYPHVPWWQLPVVHKLRTNNL